MTHQKLLCSLWPRKMYPREIFGRAMETHRHLTSENRSKSQVQFKIHTPSLQRTEDLKLKKGLAAPDIWIRRLSLMCRAVQSSSQLGERTTFRWHHHLEKAAGEHLPEKAVHGSSAPGAVGSAGSLPQPRPSCMHRHESILLLESTTAA